MENNNKSKFEINVPLFLDSIKKDKKQIAIYCIVAAVLGVTVAFSIPRIYKTSVMLAPESSSTGGLSSNISSIAEMVGMNVGLGSEDAIYPEIYPDLMNSNDFIVSLFPINVKSKDSKINTTYYNYMLSHQKFPWWSYPTILVSEFIKSLNNDNKKGNTNKVDPFWLSKTEYEIVKAISGNIDCSVDKKTSVISITATAQDPLISATLADSIKNRLQTFITDYRTKKARHDLAYMEQLYKEAKEQYTKARQRYAAYSDANQDLILESYRAKQEDLENEMQLQYNIYTQVVQQLQIAKAKVQERTPAFTVVQSASVPVKHSNKPKVLILSIFIIIGLCTRLGILLIKNKKDLISIK